MNSTLDAEAAELIARSGMSSFTTVAKSYVALPSPSQETVVVPVNHIEVFERGPGVANFNLERALAVLLGIRNGSALPPIKVHKLEQQDRYKLYDGFHRYHLSRILGFCCIPIVVVSPPY